MVIKRNVTYLLRITIYFVKNSEQFDHRYSRYQNEAAIILDIALMRTIEIKIVNSSCRLQI